MNCSWRFGTDKRTDELKIDRTTNKGENVVTLDHEAGEEEIFIINLLHQACMTGSKFQLLQTMHTSITYDQNCQVNANFHLF